jgi:hypothetical protein
MFMVPLTAGANTSDCIVKGQGEQLEISHDMIHNSGKKFASSQQCIREI